MSKLDVYFFDFTVAHRESMCNSKIEKNKINVQIKKTWNSDSYMHTGDRSFGQNMHRNAPGDSEYKQTMYLC